jgi:hypothetical protein
MASSTYYRKIPYLMYSPPTHAAAPDVMQRVKGILTADSAGVVVSLSHFFIERSGDM